MLRIFQVLYFILLFNGIITAQVFNSNIPIIKITINDIINEQFQIEGEIGIINNSSGQNRLTDTPNEYVGEIGIKHRGESSLFFPKKNFAIEMRDELGNDLDTTFLGFPKEEDWILHGPFSDKSLIRNVLTMHLANEMGQYASKTMFVNLYINSDYQGIYVLMEKIKRDKGRVDVAKLKETDIEGDELTGGYIFRIDKGQPHWLSKFTGLGQNRRLEYQIVYPDFDDVLPAQFNYIQTYVDSFEQAMKSPNLMFGGKSYAEYIDVNSFAEAHLLNEVGRNVDGYRLSSYFHKKKDSNGGKIFAGPVWDFNLAFRNADYCDGANTNGLIFYNFCDSNFPFWWDVLLQNEDFLSTTQCRWQELRAGPFHTDSIFAFIDEQVQILQPSLSQNFSKWNIFGTYVWPNPLPLANSHSHEITLLKNWLSARLRWMDSNLGGTCSFSVNTTEIITDNVFKIIPNPAQTHFSLAFPTPINKEIATIFLINNLGQQIQLPFDASNSSVAINDLTPGLYYVGVVVDGKTYLQKLMIQ